jgi:hypothetical protein
VAQAFPEQRLDGLWEVAPGQGRKSTYAARYAGYASALMICASISGFGVPVLAEAQAMAFRAGSSSPFIAGRSISITRLLGIGAPSLIVRALNS